MNPTTAGFVGAVALAVIAVCMIILTFQWT